MNTIKYYKAQIDLMVTKFNPEFNDWSGETYDQGVINTITAPNLEQLKLRLNTQYDLQDFDFYEEDVQFILLEHSFENSDGDLEDYQIRISEVFETSINLEQIRNFIKR